MSRVVSESIEQIAYGMLNTQRAYSTNNFSISVRQVDGRKLILPTLTFRASDDGESLTVAAREAELRRNSDDTLSIFLTDGTIEGPNGLEGAFSDTIERVIDLGAMREGKSLSPSDYPMHEIPAERVTQSQQIRRLEYGLAAQAAYQLFDGDFRGLVGEAWQNQEKRLRSERYRLNRLKTEPWRRWSNGFSCFFFVMIGVPWAIQRRNSDFVTIFFMCFLPILLIYYPLMAYGVDRAKEGAMPQYTVWFGNLVCGCIGFWILKRVIRQ